MGLTAQKCAAYLRDPSHIFRRMWAGEAWSKMADADGNAGSTACWLMRRELNAQIRIEPQPAADFFEQVLSGAHCDTNWYEGNVGSLGKRDARPSFPKDEAPALLGFDETLDGFCAAELGGWDQNGAKDLGHAERCVKASYNILSCAPSELNLVPYWSAGLGQHGVLQYNAPDSATTPPGAKGWACVSCSATRTGAQPVRSTHCTTRRTLRCAQIFLCCGVAVSTGIACRTTFAVTWSGKSALRRACCLVRVGGC